MTVLLWCWAMSLCVLAAPAGGEATGKELKYYEGGGHGVEWCLKRALTTDGVTCEKPGGTCSDGRYYSCDLPCGFNRLKMIAGWKHVSLEPKPGPTFSIDGNVTVDLGERVRIRSNGPVQLLQRDIRIDVLGPQNGSCSNISVEAGAVTCIPEHVNGTFNLSLSYGKVPCRRSHIIGPITIRAPHSVLELIVGAAVALVVVLTTVALAVVAVRRNKRSVQGVMTAQSKEITNNEIKFVNLQRKAFLEYQTAVVSFPDLGSLTPRHILTFYNFFSRVLNVELPAEPMAYEGFKIGTFRGFILKKDKLMEWVERIERESKSQQRSLVASLLTIVLFQHPEYFLEIIKSLLTKYIEKIKKNNEERILFRRSEAIVEKLIGNWITLCMYQSLKTGDIGKRFFNLYRAMKCKMNQGLVDSVTHKAKYALAFEHILLGDIDYETLDVKADVEVSLNMMDNHSTPLKIQLEDIDVQVLSHDSMTQVKEKILDRALMIYATMENADDLADIGDPCVEPSDLNDLKLLFVSNTTKIVLEDFDLTSVKSPTDKTYTLVNTMKHYSMKSGMRFLLKTSNVTDNESFPSIDQRCLSKPTTLKVHLQRQQDQGPVSSDLPKLAQDDSHSKILFNPVAEDLNKEAYLMLLLATKKSVIAFIEGFFQCLFNWDARQGQGTSSSPLVDEDKRTIFNSESLRSQYLANKQVYLTPVYYMFSMFDGIASSLDVMDDITISLWKSNSFILRFWVNLIKNPHFIFAVDKAGPIGDSLTTIASVLMESCSLSADKALTYMNLPIMKQLFLKEVKKYSSWWRSFTASGIKVDEESIIVMMKDIAETYRMENYYNSSIASLQAISKTLTPEVLQAEGISADNE